MSKINFAFGSKNDFKFDIQDHIISFRFFLYFVWISLFYFILSTIKIHLCLSFDFELTIRVIVTISPEFLLKYLYEISKIDRISLIVGDILILFLILFSISGMNWGEKTFFDFFQVVQSNLILFQFLSKHSKIIWNFKSVSALLILTIRCKKKVSQKNLIFKAPVKDSLEFFSSTVVSEDSISRHFRNLLFLRAVLPKEKAGDRKNAIVGIMKLIKLFPLFVTREIMKKRIYYQFICFFEGKKTRNLWTLSDC